MNITIFTPTYNRKDYLTRLYESLCSQSNHNFVWLIVDDGSTDQTKDVVEQWTAEKRLKIEYYYQDNAGKSAAHNRGVQETKTDLFVCVDSDDELTNDAVDYILHTNIEDESCIGMILKKGTIQGEPITQWNSKECVTTFRNAYAKGHLKGDAMLVYKTTIIKKHMFPDFPGEKFVPEAYLYTLLDSYGFLLVCDKVAYLCEYLDDGYSANMRKVNALNPNGYAIYIRQELEKSCDLFDRIRCTIKLMAIEMVINKKKALPNTGKTILSILCYLPALLFYSLAYKKHLSNK